MPYSQITASGPRDASNPCHLLEQAWDRYCAAREVAFESTRPGAWQRQFHRLVAEGAEILHRHADQMGKQSGPLARLARTGRSMAGGLFAAPAAPCQLADDLVAAAAAADPATLWHVVELTESCIRMEIETARHHNQLTALLEALDQAPGVLQPAR